MGYPPLFVGYGPCALHKREPIRSTFYRPVLNSTHIDIKMDTRNRTNSEWGTLIGTKIAEVEIADDDTTFGPERPSGISRLIDHTALKPETAEAQIDRLCREARKYGFKVAFQSLRTRVLFFVVQTDHNSIVLLCQRCLGTACRPQPRGFEFCGSLCGRISPGSYRYDGKSRVRRFPFTLKCSHFFPNSTHYNVLHNPPWRQPAGNPDG